MPLSLGLRDEDNERINNILKKLRELVLVPDELKLKDVEDYLGQMGMAVTDVQQEGIAASLREKGMDWENMELFADILAKLSGKPGFGDMRSSAIGIYNYIQAESKVFSFDIMNKASQLKSYIMESLAFKRIAEITPEDFYGLVERNREHIYKTFPVTTGECASLDKTKKFLENAVAAEKNGNGYYFYILINDRLNGYICIKNINRKISKCELAYFIDKSLQGMGITSAAVGQVVQFCFETLAMNKVFICTSTVNTGSQRVALKNGFVQEGVLRDEFKNGEGQLEDIVYFGLLKSDHNEK